MKPTKPAAFKTAATVQLTPGQAAAAKISPAQLKTLRQMDSTISRNKKASEVPFPGPLKQAFASTPTEILGLKLHPVTLGHTLVLTECKNPFLDGIRLSIALSNAPSDKEKTRIQAQIKAINYSPIDCAEALYIFTRTGEQLRAALAAGGPSAIRAAALKLIDTLAPVPPQFIEYALGQHYGASLVTALQIEPDNTDDKKKS